MTPEKRNGIAGLCNVPILPAVEVNCQPHCHGVVGAPYSVPWFQIFEGLRTSTQAGTAPYLHEPPVFENINNQAIRSTAGGVVAAGTISRSARV